MTSICLARRKNQLPVCVGSEKQKGSVRRSCMTVLTGYDVAGRKKNHCDSQIYLHTLYVYTHAHSSRKSTHILSHGRMSQSPDCAFNAYLLLALPTHPRSLFDVVVEIGSCILVRIQILHVSPIGAVESTSD